MARLQFERIVDAPVSVVWDVISDQDLYAEAAPNLMAVEILEGEGTGMVRRCVDKDGNAWTETCVAWEENQGFRIAVDVTDSDFHRPLFTRFEGEWRLSETPDGVVITIAFDFTPRYGPFGVLISWYLRWKAPSLIEAIFDDWEAAIEERLADTVVNGSTGPPTADATPGGGGR